MSFHDTRLPNFIEIFAVGRPSFSSSCVRTLSGREVRSLDNQNIQQHYTLTGCLLSTEQFRVFNNFFLARAGRKFSFRFRDLADYKTNLELIAIGDGERREFQLVKRYGDHINEHIRHINAPIAKTIKFYDGDHLIDFPFETCRGKIIFSENLPRDLELRADFEFDIIVRFVNDSFEYSTQTDGSILLSDVSMLEVDE